MKDIIWILLLGTARLSVLVLLGFIALKWLGQRLTAHVRYTIWRILAILAVIPTNVPSPLIPVTSSSFPTGAAADTAFTDTPTAPSPSVDIWQMLFVLWLAGTIGFFTYHIVKNRRHLSLIRRWCTPDWQSQPILAHSKRELHLSQSVRLFRSKAVASPMAFGLWHPTVVIPCRTYTDDELLLIFRHELTHIARKDGLFKGIALLAASLHWYNPFVYLLVHQLNHECELSCDEKILFLCRREEQFLYGQLLLQSASKSTNAFGLYTSMAVKQSALKARLKAVIGGRIRSNPALCGAFLAVFLTTALLMPCTVGYAKTPTGQHVPLPSHQREEVLPSRKPFQDTPHTTVTESTTSMAQGSTHDPTRSHAGRRTTVHTTMADTTATDNIVVTSLAYTTQPQQNMRLTTTVTATATATSLATYAVTYPTDASTTYTEPATLDTTTVTVTAAATHLNPAP